MAEKLTPAQIHFMVELLDYPCSDAEDTERFYQVYYGRSRTMAERVIEKGGPIKMWPNPHFSYYSNIARICPGEDKCECKTKKHKTP